MFIKTTSVLIGLVTLCFSTSLFAAKVLQSKNGKVMIDLEGDAAIADQMIILVNDQNKKVAIAQITQVKNGKAIATITKGQSLGNEKITFAAKPKTTNNVVNNSPDTTSNKVSQQNTTMYRTDSKRMSVVLSIMSNTMNTKQSDGVQPTPNNEDVGMKGNTFGVTAVVDWPVFKSFTLRGTLGFEPFKVAGTSNFLSCDKSRSTDCTAEITYLSAGGYARFDFNSSQAQFWAAGGGAFKLPLSKSTTALNPDDIKPTFTYGVALGLDYFINNKTFIPFSVEKQLFLKSDTVSADILFLRAGYGLTF